MTDRIIFHVDANSAFLSWSAAYRVLVLGEEEDLRDVPSVIAGDKASRHSIILAKSNPAKKYGIQTGEPLFQALEKCPDLIIAPPDYGLYVEASRHFVEMLRQFSPMVQQYSIDEAWVDMTGTQRIFGSPRLAAEKMRQQIWEELGFTVNVGISSNKLLAKMKIQHRVGAAWVINSPYNRMGYVVNRTIERGINFYTHTYWTQKGRLFLYDFLKARGILPLIEQEG